MVDENNVWYRYEDYLVADWDPWAEYYQPNTSHSAIRCLEYRLLRCTEKGVWLDIGGGAQRFVLNESRKRYACPTKEDAMVSFLARKSRQLYILRNQVRHVKSVISLAKENDVAFGS